MREQHDSLIKKWKERTRVLKCDIQALFLAYQHPRTPWYAKLFSAVVVAYAFSPIDLIPDFIPVFGYLDDLVLVPLGITVAIKMIPKEVMAECRSRVVERSESGKPVSWPVAVGIVMFWILLLYLFAKWILTAASRIF